MADQEDAADVFRVPDLWKASKWLNSACPGPNEFFDLDLQTSCPPSWTLPSSTPGVKSPAGFFQLPKRLFSLEDKTQPGSSSEPPEAESSETAAGDNADFFNDGWILGEENLRQTFEYRSWDGFAMPEIPPAKPLFLTEAGASVFEAALQAHEDPLAMKNTHHNVVQTNPYVAALLALTMGRASIFFTWDDKLGTFVQDLDKLRVSGYSADVLSGLQSRCLQSGNIVRFLLMFVNITYKTHPSAGRVALAKIVDVLVTVIQATLGNQVSGIRSLLHLQSLVRPVYTILTYFKALVAKLGKARTDEHMLSILFEETQTLENRTELLSDMMREVLSQVSQSWIDFAQQWLGIISEGGNPVTKDSTGRSFVRVDTIPYMDDFGVEVDEPDYVLDERHMPDFIHDEIAQVLFETGRNLRLLRMHHPQHPLCNPELIQSHHPPAFKWLFDWGSVEELRNKVDEYELSISETVRLHKLGQKFSIMKEQTRLPGAHSLQFFGWEKDQLAAQLTASIKTLDGLPTVEGDEDRLTHLLQKRLFAGTQETEPKGLALEPHWSLLPLLSFGPLVEAQARLVNREYIGLLFSSHKLREHMSVHKSFHLLGNGVFCSRLSHALFDPELETAERVAGVARQGGVMGLRLGSRDSWPPASSELRLALMGVLSESYAASSTKTSAVGEEENMPGDLSFAVRDLSDEEIDRCMDPDSLEALDFLRLSYKPPAPLAPIMTPAILAKYDKIFKLLLRVLRLLYTASELYRDVNARTSRWSDINNSSLRFRFEAQHFMSSITTYFFDTGIGIPWQQFDSRLDIIESSLTVRDANPREIQLPSADGLRELHEQTLDRILHCLFLRKRQQPVLRVLEDIFALILKFSKSARSEALGRGQNDPARTSSRDLYEAFRKKVEVFLTVCRGLSEKDGLQSKFTAGTNNTPQDLSGVREENRVDRLLVFLESSGYYGGQRM